MILAVKNLGNSLHTPVIGAGIIKIYIQNLCLLAVKNLGNSLHTPVIGAGIIKIYIQNLCCHGQGHTV